MTRLTTIFSTGDAGAARGALDAAAELDLKIDGHTAVTDLPAPHAEHLRRTLAPRMAARLNVQDSDGTLIVSFGTSLREGSPAAYADEAVEQQRKPSLHIVLPHGGHPEDVRREVLAFVAEEKIATLHVTGPREAEEPGIQQAVHDALVWIFEDEVERAAASESLREAIDEEHAAFERVAEHHEAFRAEVADTIERIAGDDDARLQAIAELAHRAGDQPTHIAINPANVDAAIAAGLDVQWIAPSDAPFTVDAAHAPPTVRPWKSPAPVPAEVIDRVCRETGVTFRNEERPLAETAEPVLAVPRAEAMSTMTMRGRVLAKVAAATRKIDEVNAFVASVGCAVVGDAGAIEPAEASKLFRAGDWPPVPGGCTIGDRPAIEERPPLPGDQDGNITRRPTGEDEGKPRTIDDVVSPLGVTWAEVRQRSEAAGARGRTTFCADCYFMFASGGVPCRKHTLDSEVDARDRLVNGTGPV